MIPWFAPELDDHEIDRVVAVLRSNYVNDGEVTRELEQRVAELVGVRHAVAVTSGTTAIAAALMAVGIGAGDEVLVPAFTFIATANAVRLAGADVKLVDIEPARLLVDPAKIEAAIGPRTRAIVPVDVNGRGVDYRAVAELTARHGLRTICDVAEGLGSSWGGRKLGAWGDAGCFSFSPNKTITTGQGGIIVTDDDRIHDRLRELKDQGRRHQGTGGADRHPVLGFNFKLTNLQAAVGLAQLDKLEQRLARARQRQDAYRERLADCSGVTLPAVEPGEILQWTDLLVEGERAVVETALGREQMGYRAFWLPLHSQEPYAEPTGTHPVAERVSGQGLWLPSAFDLTEAQVDRVAATIRRAVGHG